MNLAAVWKLPTIFVCQNNLFAEHTKFEKMTGGQNIAARADGYGIPGVRVDGNDPEAMYSAFAEAVARARAGEGPTLLECMTFRFRSEEHTSELQSLMRISYAVFCLKKKKTNHDE